MKIIITGGAGFIGFSLSNYLLENGHNVTIYDNFCEQIHGKNPDIESFRKTGIEIIEGDITDKEKLWKALKDKEVVIHFAAQTGTGQSMYNVYHYNHTNVCGTANVCDYLYNKESRIEKIILASSRSIYGEGKYFCKNCGVVYPYSRDIESIKLGNFSPRCPVCKSMDSLNPLATDEDSFLRPSSVYAGTKLAQEILIDITAKSLNLSSFCLRFQNVYGPGQSLINPYTGILAIFLRLALQNKDIEIFEDGEESRDFVYIDDVVKAVSQSIFSSEKGNFILNVGSGISTTVLEVANLIKDNVHSTSKIKISKSFRLGDIRHNFADTTRIEKLLSFSPGWTFQNGLARFIESALNSPQLSQVNNFENSMKELINNGLYIK